MRLDERPELFSWNPEDGRPVDDADFKIAQGSRQKRKRVFSYYGDDMGSVLTEDGKRLHRPGRHPRGLFYNRMASKRNFGQKPRTA